MVLGYPTDRFPVRLTTSAEINLYPEVMMFGLSNKKSKLEKKYKKLLDEAYRLSHTDRRKSDEKTAEAEEVRLQLEAMENEAKD
jgi:hypothetical protein